ncbi:hypothetical protein HMPREF0973_00148 [Prevotella veroralis F0319]|uniref:Uncharacterized protein n=1 Tax=Prevotella veroralis F0319 TaxID=649761 RepID=C9MKM4_9BACT|nr:hypothetical protein HMPREF0973_00148 [Prevotella veroralis F0319]
MQRYELYPKQATLFTYFYLSTNLFRRWIISKRSLFFNSKFKVHNSKL